MTRLSRNTLLLLANNILTSVLSLLLTVLITRGLGDAGFGQYAAIMAWILPFTMLADGGLNTLLTRNVAQNPTSAHTILRHFLPLRLIIAAVLIGIAWFGAPFFSADQMVVVGIQIGIWLAIIDAFFGGYTAVFRAWEVMWPMVLLNALFFGFQIIGALWIISRQEDVIGLVSIIVLADVAQLGLTWLLWRFGLRHLYPATQLPTVSWIATLRQAYPFALAGLLAMLNMRVMIVLLDQYLSPQAVGWYALAFRLLEAARLAPNALFVALFPRLAALATEPTAFRQLARQAWIWLVGYGLVVSSITTLVGRWLVPRVFGLDFQPTVGVLNVLIWVLLPSTGRALLTLQLYAHNRQQWVNGALAMGIVVQVGTGYGLVQWYGLYGTPLAVIISEVVLMLCLGWALKQTMAMAEQKTQDINILGG